MQITLRKQIKTQDRILRNSHILQVVEGREASSFHYVVNIKIAGTAISLYR